MNSITSNGNPCVTLPTNTHLTPTVRGTAHQHSPRYYPLGSALHLSWIRALLKKKSATHRRRCKALGQLS